VKRRERERKVGKWVKDVGCGCGVGSSREQSSTADNLFLIFFIKIDEEFAGNFWNTHRTKEPAS
jgi:hypothetical protein